MPFTHTQRIRTSQRAFVVAIALAACFAWPSVARAQTGKENEAAASSLLVLNKAGNTLAIIDPERMRVVARVPVGVGPHEVVTSPDGRFAYVTNYGAQQPGNSISVVDLAARKEAKRIDLGPLMRPHGIVERDGKIYFTVETNRAVARYDPATDKVDFIMGTGERVTHMLVMHPTRPVIYTTNIGSDSVTVIELDRQGQPGPPPRVTQIKVGPQPEGLDVSPDGRELWVGHNGDGGVSVIDTETNTVKESFKAGGVPIRIKFTPDGKRALISSPPSGEVALFDAATRKEIKRLQVGGTPIGILIAPDGKRAYAATAQANKIVALDLSDLTVAGSVETGEGPDGLGWAGK